MIFNPYYDNMRTCQKYINGLAFQSLKHEILQDGNPSKIGRKCSYIKRNPRLKFIKPKWVFLRF